MMQVIKTRSLLLVLATLFLLVKFSLGASLIQDLDSYSAITADEGSSSKLLDLVAQEAAPMPGEGRLNRIESLMTSNVVIKKINIYTPQRLDVAERYAANLVAISRLREEILVDSKEYCESIKSQLKAIPESKRLKETLSAAEAKVKRAEEDYLESKKAADRALQIYMSFLRPTTENVLIKAEATEGKGLKIAHTELSNMESISLPDMDKSDYEPLDADSSLLSIAESVLPPEETKESLINKALDKISATIEDDFLNNNSGEGDKKLVVENVVSDDEDEEDDDDDNKGFDVRDKGLVTKETKDVSINKSETISQVGNSGELLESAVSVETSGGKNDKVITSIPSSVSASFPSAIDVENGNKKIVVISGVTTLSGRVPAYLQYVFRRSYILAYVVSTFVEAYVLPQFFTENPEIKLYSPFRIKRTLTSHVLFGLASRYRVIFKELQRLPFVYKDSELKEKISNTAFDLSATNLLLQEALSNSEENYKTVVGLLVEFPFNVRGVFSRFSADSRVNYPNTDYSFVMNDSVYSAPRVFFPELISSEIENLKLFDKELSSQLEKFDLKESLNDLKESQFWIKDYVLRNAAYRYTQFENNYNIRPYFNFAQFNVVPVPQVEEILKKSSGNKR